MTGEAPFVLRSHDDEMWERLTSAGPLYDAMGKKISSRDKAVSGPPGGAGGRSTRMHPQLSTAQHNTTTHLNHTHFETVAQKQSAFTLTHNYTHNYHTHTTATPVQQSRPPALCRRRLLPAARHSLLAACSMASTARVSPIRRHSSSPRQYSQGGLRLPAERGPVDLPRDRGAAPDLKR